MDNLVILATCNARAAELASHTLFKENGDARNVLEEFWYGNLDPAEYDANSKEYKELVRLISQNEEKLPAIKTEEKIILQVYRLCSGTPGDGRVFAVSK